MVATDQQVRKLRKLIHMGKTQEIAAMKSGMDVGTARKYLKADALPSELIESRPLSRLSLLS